MIVLFLQSKLCRDVMIEQFFLSLLMASQKIHLRAALRSNLVTTVYLYVRLIPWFSQALHLELFALPSQWREFASS